MAPTQASTLSILDMPSFRLRERRATSASTIGQIDRRSLIKAKAVLQKLDESLRSYDQVGILDRVLSLVTTRLGGRPSPFDVLGTLGPRTLNTVLHKLNLARLLVTSGVKSGELESFVDNCGQKLDTFSRCVKRYPFEDLFLFVKISKISPSFKCPCRGVIIDAVQKVLTCISLTRFNIRGRHSFRKFHISSVAST